jgi:hypothetical protein
MLISIVKVLSTEIDKAKQRVVKFLRYGKHDFQTCLESGPFGIDSNPVKDLVAVYAQTGMNDTQVIIGYINRNQLAKVGEFRIYATDEKGELKTYQWLHSDGTMEIGGNSDNLVRYSKLEDVIKELHDDNRKLKQAFANWAPAPNDGGSALKIAASSWLSTPLSKEISLAKIKELKVK